MSGEQTRPRGKDAAAARGISAALGQAFKVNPLLVDQAADADFASMIDRLRGEPGSHQGGKQ